MLFSDEQRLTSDSGANDLYQCEMIEGPEGVECRLSDLTPRTADGESGDPRGMVIGAAGDGSWLYFVAGAVYTRTPDSEGESAVPGGYNLYARHEGEAAPRLVAVLSSTDGNDWGGTQGPAPGKLTARVSPSGQWLAFMSNRSLTGYDNHDTRSGAPDEELFEYDAQDNRVACVSCNPTGARPAGIEIPFGSFIHTLAIIGSSVWNNGTSLAVEVPTWDVSRSEGDGFPSSFQPRYLTDEGRAFFDSTDALVPADVNGVGDVYEFEPAGVGGCSESTRSAAVEYVPSEGGCVGLISSGASAEEAAFYEASENGDDVFFFTGAKLSPADYDTSLDVYDAHLCSAQAPCFPPPAEQAPACVTADACRAAPTPQPEVFGAPASATFSDSGNVSSIPPLAVGKKVTKKTVKCKKTRNGSRRGEKGKCVRKKSKKSAKRASNERRTER